MWNSTTCRLKVLITVLLCSSQHNGTLSVAFCYLFGLCPVLKTFPVLITLRDTFYFNCANQHLLWIACVRMKAWAGHGPSSASCSRLDSLQLASCEFTLELFFIWTRDGCTGSQQAWQEVNKSKAGGPEKGWQNFPFYSFFYKMHFFHLLLLYVSVCGCIKKPLALSFAVFQLYVSGSQRMKVCLSPGLLFSLQKAQHVGPIATVVWIPSSSFAPYLLIAIYKEKGGGKCGVCAPPQCLQSFILAHVAVGRARPSPGNTYLLSVWDAFYVNHSGDRMGVIPMKIRQIVFL